MDSDKTLNQKWVSWIQTMYFRTPFKELFHVLSRFLKKTKQNKATQNKTKKPPFAKYRRFLTKRRNQVMHVWLSNVAIFSQIKQFHNCYMLLLSQMFLLFGVRYLDYIKHMILRLGRTATPESLYLKPGSQMLLGKQACWSST